MSVNAYAEDVYTELTARGIGGGVIAGHSLGGAIALRLAIDHADFAQRLVLVGTGARLRVAPVLLDAARPGDLEAGKTLAATAFASDHEEQMRAFFLAQAPLAPGMLYRDLAACDAFDVMTDLDTITQPTLIVVGDSDRLTPPKYADYLAQHLPTATLVVIPDAGHYVQVEQPAAVAEALRDWLK
jgi:pimeloyl-ACP methyl ester carboxylesterase